MYIESTAEIPAIVLVTIDATTNIDTYRNRKAPKYAQATWKRPGWLPPGREAIWEAEVL
jgi:hypothetical protein